MSTIITRTSAIAVVALAATIGVASVEAQQPRSSGSGTSAATPSQASERSVLASGFRATVSGNVTKIDQQSGRMTISTADGPMTVRFPPAAVQHVKQGDQVTVMVGLVESNPPSASPGTKSDSGTSGATGGGTGPSGGASSGTKR